MATIVTTRAELDALLGDGKRCLVLVIGQGQGFEQIVRNADDAVMFAPIQAVGWVRDRSLLTAEEHASFQPGDPRYVACAHSRPPRKVCARVSREFALTLTFIQAFADAEQVTQPPALHE